MIVNKKSLLKENVEIRGNLDLSNNLNVNGISTLTGKINMKNDLDVSGSAETSYGTKTADDMGMQIHEGSAVTGQVFEDVDEATLEDET